jgi:hypothetical protein
MEIENVCEENEMGSGKTCGGETGKGISSVFSLGLGSENDHGAPHPCHGGREYAHQRPW